MCFYQVSSFLMSLNGSAIIKYYKVVAGNEADVYVFTQKLAQKFETMPLLFHLYTIISNQQNPAGVELKLFDSDPLKQNK
eukprot:gene448-231_t